MNKGHHDVIMECAEFALERLHGPLNRELEGRGPQRPRPMLQPQSFVLDCHMSSPLTTLAEAWSPSLSCGLETPPPSKLSVKLLK